MSMKCLNRSCTVSSPGSCVMGLVGTAEPCGGDCNASGVASAAGALCTSAAAVDDATCTSRVLITMQVSGCRPKQRHNRDTRSLGALGQNVAMSPAARDGGRWSHSNSRWRTSCSHSLAVMRVLVVNLPVHSLLPLTHTWASTGSEGKKALRACQPAEGGRWAADTLLPLADLGSAGCTVYRHASSSGESSTTQPGGRGCSFKASGHKTFSHSSRSPARTHHKTDN